MAKKVKHILSSREAAELLCIHVNTLLSWPQAKLDYQASANGYRKYNRADVMKLRRSMKLKPQENTLLSASQAAQILGVHRNSISNYVKRGQIKAHTLPSGYHRFYLEEIQTFKKSLETKNQ